MCVSIILPNYNHAQYLQERLYSIFNQTHQDIEVIILDDASTDESKNILENYKKHPNVSHFILNNKNSGSPFKQWYKGLQLAQGDYVWIAESDDSCELDFLEKNLLKIHQLESDLIVADTYLYYKHKNNKQRLNHSLFIGGENKIIDYEDFGSCPIGNISGVLFKRPSTDELLISEFYNFKIIGDYIFYFEFFLKKRAVLNSITKSYFRQSSDSVSNVNSKTIHYYKCYFQEHLNFLDLVSRKIKINTLSWPKPFLLKRFQRIKNRTTRRQKMTLNYLLIYIKFKFYFFNNSL